MRFQPSGLEREHRVARRVGLGEGVARELLHLIEDVVGNAPGRRRRRPVPAKNMVRMVAHFRRLFLRHGATQQIRLAERKTGESLRHVHHLLLIEHHAVGRPERVRQRRMREYDRRLAVLARDVVVHRPGLQRPRAIQRHQGDEVVDGVRQQAADEFLHSFRFKLEYRGRLPGLQHLEGTRVIERQRLRLHVRLAPRGALGVDGADRPVDDGERLEP